MEQGDEKVNSIIYYKKLYINIILIKIERILPISNLDQMRELVYILKDKVYFNLFDDYL
jgi:hypothetical protein